MDMELEIANVHTNVKQCLSGDKISKWVDTISNQN